MSILAESFACEAHKNQRRKYAGEPYIVHPARVVGLITSVTGDQATIDAAWLHDTVEDTSVTPEQIKEVFGDEIAKLVEEVTNVTKKTDGNRAYRKSIERQHLAKASPRAKTIKLADVIDNVTDIMRNDRDFAKVFVPEKLELLNYLTDGDPVLFQEAKRLILDSLLELGLN